MGGTVCIKTQAPSSSPLMMSMSNPGAITRGSWEQLRLTQGGVTENQALPCWNIITMLAVFAVLNITTMQILPWHEQ